MSLCKYRSSAHLLKLTRTSLKLTGKLVCDVARLVPFSASEVIRHAGAIQIRLLLLLLMYRPILTSIAGEAF